MDFGLEIKPFFRLFDNALFFGYSEIKKARFYMQVTKLNITVPFEQKALAVKRVFVLRNASYD